DQLELAVPDLGIQQVDARRPHRHQHVMLADIGLGHLAPLHAVFAAIPADYERFHEVSSLSSRASAGDPAGLVACSGRLKYDRNIIISGWQASGASGKERGVARYGKQHKEATRRRIVEMAGRRLKADG